jgi:hypothetical protein
MDIVEIIAKRIDVLEEVKAELLDFRFAKPMITFYTEVESFDNATFPPTCNMEVKSKYLYTLKEVEEFEKELVPIGESRDKIGQKSLIPFDGNIWKQAACCLQIQIIDGTKNEDKERQGTQTHHCQCNEASNTEVSS